MSRIEFEDTIDEFFWKLQSFARIIGETDLSYEGAEIAPILEVLIEHAKAKAKDSLRGYLL